MGSDTLVFTAAQNFMRILPEWRPILCRGILESGELIFPLILALFFLWKTIYRARLVDSCIRARGIPLASCCRCCWIPQGETVLHLFIHSDIATRYGNVLVISFDFHFSSRQFFRLFTLGWKCWLNRLSLTYVVLDLQRNLGGDGSFHAPGDLNLT